MSKFEKLACKMVLMFLFMVALLTSCNFGGSSDALTTGETDGQIERTGVVIGADVTLAPGAIGRLSASV